MVVAMVALFCSLAGNAVAVTGAFHRSSMGKLNYRIGRLVDTDTTAADGQFNFAIGHATCKKGERVLSGGPRQVAGNPGDTQHISMVESSPTPKKRSWSVKMNSDRGGAARHDWRVVAVCAPR